MFTKPRSRKSLKAAAKRRESKILHMVRMHDVVRDGHCRLGEGGFSFTEARENWWCEGKSELAHLEDKRRFKTRGQKPELRHTTAGTCMLCEKHHRLYDKSNTARVISLE